MTTGMKDQIQQLIAAGQTKDALSLLVQTNGDALLLQAQYNNGEKQFNLGLIDFGEWQRIQARVNFAALEMAGKTDVVPPAPAPVGTRVPSNPGTRPSPGTSGEQPQPVKASVFISYNHHDTFAMRAIKAYLEDHDIRAFVDIHDMNVGEKIEDFIDKAFKENQFILSVISQNSLKSGWINKEFTSALLLNRFGNKWIPVLLDRSCFDAKFYNDTMDAFDAQLKAIDAEIKTAMKKNRGIQAFTDERERLNDLRNDFDKTIQALKKHLVEDISGNLFDHGMARVVKVIKGA